MPELPEVESVRRSLAPHVIGRRVVRARARRRDVVRGKASPGALLEGDRIRHLHRRGKQLGIEGEGGGVIVVHLGMSGQLLTADRSRRYPSHTHVVWKFDDFDDLQSTRGLLFRDPRRFGGVWTFPSLEHARRERWDELGPEGTEISSSDLSRALAGSRRRIKSLLLMQERVAGLGNIYADESLFRAGVSPWRQANSLEPEEMADLARSIREVLVSASDRGGSTLSDEGYVNADGEPGSFQDELRVYGRGGASCVRCGGELAQDRLEQRSTVWCPTCQP